MPARSTVDQSATAAWVQVLTTLQQHPNPSGGVTFPPSQLRLARQATDAYCAANGLRQGSARTDSYLQALVKQAPGNPRQGLMACAHWMSERGAAHALDQGVRQLRAELQAYAVSDAQETAATLLQLLAERSEPALLMAAAGVAALEASLTQPKVVPAAKALWVALQDLRAAHGSFELAELLMERVVWHLDLFAAQAWALVHADQGAKVLADLPLLHELCDVGVMLSPQLSPLLAWKPDDARVTQFAAWNAAGLTSTYPWLAALAHLEGPAEGCAWESLWNTTKWAPGGHETSLRAFVATRTLGSTDARAGALQTPRGGKIQVDVGAGESCGQAVALLSDAVVGKVAAVSGAQQMLLLDLCTLALPLSHRKVAALADVADFKDNSEALLKSIFDDATLGIAQGLLADALDEELEQLRNDVAHLARTQTDNATQAACANLQAQLKAMTPMAGDLLGAASKALRACARSIDGGRGVEMSFDLTGLSVAQKQAYGLSLSKNLLLRVVFSNPGDPPRFALVHDQGMAGGSVTPVLATSIDSAAGKRCSKLSSAFRWISVTRRKGKQPAVGAPLVLQGSPPANSRAVFQLTRLIARDLQQAAGVRSNAQTVQGVYDLVVARLPKLADNCLVCDAVQAADLARPTTCASSACAQTLQTQGADALLQDVRESPEVADFLRRMATDSPSTIKALPNRLAASPTALQTFGRQLPPLGPTSDLRQQLGATDTNAWVDMLSKFRAHIVKVPPASQWDIAQTPFQYEVRSMPPEVQRRFGKPTGSNLRYLFHASPAANWYSILQQGIRPSATGSYGRGVYLAAPAATNYMHGRGIVAACVVNLQPNDAAQGQIYCVRDEARVLPRYLFVYENGYPSNPLTEESFRQWMP